VKTQWKLRSIKCSQRQKKNWNYVDFFKPDRKNLALPNTDYSIDQRQGVVSSYKENGERNTNYSFDNLGRLTRIKNDRGSEFSVSYQDNSPLPNLYTENFQSYTLSFDPFYFQPLSVTTPLGATWSYTYSPEGITQKVYKANPENNQNELLFSQEINDPSDLTVWNVFFKGTNYTQELDTWGRPFAVTSYGKRKLYSGKSFKSLDGKNLRETMPSYGGFSEDTEKTWAYDHLGRVVLSRDKRRGKKVEIKYEKGLKIYFTNGKQSEVTKKTLTGKILSQEKQGEKLTFSPNAFGDLTGLREFGEKWSYNRYGVSLSNLGAKPSWKIDYRSFDKSGLIESRMDSGIMIQSDDKGRILKTSNIGLGNNFAAIFYQANFENDLLSSEIFTWGKDNSEAKKNSYLYNSDGLLTELKSNMVSQNWTYDFFGRLQSDSAGVYTYDAQAVSSLSPYISQLERDAFGNIISIQYASGLLTSINYEKQTKTKIEASFNKTTLFKIETKLNEDIQIKERATESNLKNQTLENFNYNAKTLLFESATAKQAVQRNQKGQVTGYNGMTFSWDGENLSVISGVGNFYYSPKGELQIAQVNGLTLKKLGNESYLINDKIVRLITIDKLAVGVMIDKRFFPIVSDHLGSIVSMFDESGKNLLWHRSYDAWGKKTVAYSTTNSEAKSLEQLCLWSFAHLKEIPDVNILTSASTTNLYWSKSRVYLAEAQEWLSVDPLLKWNPNSLIANPGNWMGIRYVNNDPLNFVDESGYLGIGVGGGFNVTMGPLRFDGNVDLRVVHDSTKSMFDVSSYSIGLHYTSPSVTAFGDKTRTGYKSGVAGIHFDAGFNFKKNNADNISQLSGKTLNSGFTLGKGVDLGFDLTTSIRDLNGAELRNNSGLPVSEVSFSLGGGLGVEGHVTIESENRGIFNINSN